MHSHDQLFLTASSTYGHGELDGPEFSKPLLWPCSWYAAKKSTLASTSHPSRRAVIRTSASTDSNAAPPPTLPDGQAILIWTQGRGTRASHSKAPARYAIGRLVWRGNLRRMQDQTYPAPNNGAFSYKEEPLADWTLARPGPA